MDENVVQRYAPVLKFSKGENFFPMRVDDYLNLCTFHDSTGKEKPAAVTLELLKHKPDARYFLVYADPRDRPVNLQAVALAQWPQLLSLDRAQRGTGSRLMLNAVTASRFLPSGLLPNNLTMYLAFRAAGFMGIDLNKVDIVDSFVDAALGILKKQGRRAWKRVRNLLGPLCLPKKALDQALKQYKTVKAAPRTCYYHIVPKTDSAGIDTVLYWYFYAFNDGINWHEADWENVTLFFRDDRPFHAEYCFHTSHQGGPLNGQPEVYVALGSHASYENLNTFDFVDIFEPGGETVRDWVCLPLTESLPDWIDFQGKWGSLRQEGIMQLTGKLAGPPNGPKQHHDVWHNPVRWAGL